MVHGVVRRKQIPQLPKGEPGLLRHQNQRHLGQVPTPIPTLPKEVPLRIKEPDRFPVPQHMRGQAEPFGQLAD